MPPFDYHLAFERNLGLFTQAEQERLRHARIAIAGCGGVGGAHALTLARLGIGRFRLADFDTFDLPNSNRQAGACQSTIGRNKAETIRDILLDINPEAEVDVLREPITAANAGAFVAEADLVLDGIDFFALQARRALFQAAWRHRIPALTAAPLGFSGTLHVFAPGGMSLDDYFGFYDGQPKGEAVLRFLVGLAPAGLHRGYMNLSTVDPETGRGPSAILGVQMAACLVGGAAIGLLLPRYAPPPPAPAYLQFDTVRQRFSQGYIRWGYRHPLHRLRLMAARRMLERHGLGRLFSGEAT